MFALYSTLIAQSIPLLQVFENAGIPLFFGIVLTFILKGHSSLTDRNFAMQERIIKVVENNTQALNNLEGAFKNLAVYVKKK